MFCLQCGAKVPDESLFCLKCGYKFPKEVLAAGSQVSEKKTDPSFLNGKALICKMCNSNIVSRDGSMYICQSCGTRYTAEEAKRLTIKITDPVKIDNSDEIKNLFILARRAGNDKKFAEAISFYEKILLKEANSWEANFCILYYKAFSIEMIHVATYANRIIASMNRICSMIQSELTNRKEQYSALNYIKDALMRLVNVWIEASEIILKSINNNMSGKQLAHVYQCYADQCIPCVNIGYALGDSIVSMFGYDYSKITFACWDFAIAKSKEVTQKLKGSAIKQTRQKCESYENGYMLKKQKAEQLYNQRIAETREIYWDKNRDKQKELYSRRSLLSAHLNNIVSAKEKSDQQIREYKQQLKKPSVMFDSKAREEVKANLEIALEENKKISDDIAATQADIDGIHKELNADRLFEV